VIEQVDELLANWAQTVLGEGTVSFGVPDNHHGQAAIQIYLLDLVDCPPPRGGIGTPPLQFALRYLVTTSIGESGNFKEAHRLLSQLVFAAMETSEFEIELNGLPASTWYALGIVPRPCFLLRVPVRKERPAPATQLVRYPPLVEVTSLTSLQGVVLGPNQVPWVGARVELLSLQISTRTNTKGQFRFPSVPREPQAKQLRIDAKGREFNVVVQQPLLDNESVEVRLDPLLGNQ
jgi:hypothetical protein